MKYIIFKYKTGILMPIIFPQHVTHSMISIFEAEPIRAGFCKLNAIGLFTVYGESESLKLTINKEEDERLLNCILVNAPTSSYLDL